MALDLTKADAVLKQYYTPQRVDMLVYRNNPLFALMPKMEKFGGKNLPLPLNYGNPQGRSKTFSNAKTRGYATSSKYEDFVLTRAKDYSIATIDNETMHASMSNESAFLDTAKREMDGAIMSLTRSIAIGMYGDSAAALGQVLAEPSETSSTFTITLKLASTVTNFEVGQMLVIWSAKSGGTQRTSDGTDDEWEIVGVNRSQSTATLTLSGTYNSSGTIAADDFIFVEGDRGLGISGLSAWVPATAPASTAFFGVDRTQDVTRLGGLRLDMSSAPIEEALIEGDAYASREGAILDHYFINNQDYADLKKALGTKVEYVDLKIGKEAVVSFRGILIDGQKGPIKVVPDQNCPKNSVFGVQMDTWKLYTLDKAVSVVTDDGLTWLRASDEDSYEVRYRFYGNVGCTAPGYNINITI